jgi:hypothetical protein
MSVRAIGPVAGQLTALAMARKKFDITLMETNDGHDWSFHSLVLGNCVITSAAPSNATISGAPSATFSGVSLNSTAETKAAGKAVIP